MKLHIITIGEPKLAYARLGWQEYLTRLQRLHTVTVTHISDKLNTPKHILGVIDTSFLVALDENGSELTSQGLSDFLQKQQLTSKTISCIIGGADGLPLEVLKRADYTLSLGRLTLPHDLAMVVLLEALYRASTIASGHPYHRN